MPNRVIKESIKTSEQIDTLTWFEEVLYYRLIVTADDYGCTDGRITLLKNELFPLKENVTKKAVSDAIDKLASVDLLRKYTVSGKPYLFFPTWEKHQRVRNKRRKYPIPSDENTGLSNDGQMTASCQSESESESNPNPNPESDVRVREEEFDAFWKAYPKKTGKQDARKAFLKISVPISVLLTAVESQKTWQQWQRDGGRYIPNPSTWLNQGRWEDEEYKSQDVGTVYKGGDFFDGD